MAFTDFEKKFLLYLKENDQKKCISLIEDNEKLIQSYSQDSSYSNELINNINTVILEDLKKYKLIEKVLRYESFTNVLEKFRESDIVIKACKTENIDALKWLLTMDINPGVRDENGMTALMHAALHKSLLFVVDYYVNLKGNNKFINAVDNNGETALFHAIVNVDIFLKLISDSRIDINKKNNNNETIFIYCCKRNIIDIVHKLIYRCAECDFSCTDNAGRTGLMYLVENEREIPYCSSIKKADLEYRNKNNETVLSLLVKQFYKTWQNEDYYLETRKEKLKVLIRTFKNLLRFGCDFNSPIDEDGNTIMNFFLMIDDLPSAYYLLKKYEDLDLSIKNVDGINASYLSLFMSDNNDMANSLGLRGLILYHKTFDHCYLDRNGNNLLMHELVRDNRHAYGRHAYHLLNDNTKILNQTNNKKENVVIAAVKLGRFDYIDDKVINTVNLNQQDEQGNTALHYALKLRDNDVINRLNNHHVNKELKNNQGETPMDLAFEMKKQNENSDERVNNSIKAYLLEQYKKEYDELLIRPYTRYTSNLKRIGMKWDLYFMFEQPNEYGNKRRINGQRGIYINGYNGKGYYYLK